MRRAVTFLLVVVILTSVACTHTAPAPVARYSPSPPQAELDTIYTLLAYSVVFKNWQTTFTPGEARGNNIGAVLVDGSNNVVCWAVNSAHAAGNSTHHAETRLMMNYLSNATQFNLAGHSVYTTLEPCAMCAGMMTMQAIAKTIYGQRDPNYGHALERLAFDSSAIGGYDPYPRTVISAPASTSHTHALDEAYRRYAASEESPRIIRWLTTPEARTIYESAFNAFRQYTVMYPENQRHLDAARELLENVPSTYQPIPYAQGCAAR